MRRCVPEELEIDREPAGAQDQADDGLVERDRGAVEHLRDHRLDCRCVAHRTLVDCQEAHDERDTRTDQADGDDDLYDAGDPPESGCHLDLEGVIQMPTRPAVAILIVVNLTELLVDDTGFVACACERIELARQFVRPFDGQHPPDEEDDAVDLHQVVRGVGLNHVIEPARHVGHSNGCHEGDVDHPELQHQKPTKALRAGTRNYLKRAHRLFLDCFLFLPSLYVSPTLCQYCHSIL